MIRSLLLFGALALGCGGLFDRPDLRSSREIIDADGIPRDIETDEVGVGECLMLTARWPLDCPSNLNPMADPRNTSCVPAADAAVLRPPVAPQGWTLRASGYEGSWELCCVQPGQAEVTAEVSWDGDPMRLEAAITCR